MNGRSFQEPTDEGLRSKPRFQLLERLEYPEGEFSALTKLHPRRFLVSNAVYVLTDLLNSPYSEAVVKSQGNDPTKTQSH